MDRKITLAFFLIAVFQNLLFGQISILGSLVMGDTAQVHFLTTDRNDEFVGTALSWNADSLVFITKSNVRLAFNVAEVNSIEVRNGSEADIVSTKIFVLKTKDGKTFYGYPTRIHPDRISFLTGGTGVKRFNPKQVVSITQTSTMNLILQEPFRNLYTLKAYTRSKEYGELISFDDNEVAILNEKGARITSPLDKIQKFELTPTHAPFKGYGRSLMYLQTGFGMEAGTREYRNIMLGINIVSIGVTDHFSMGLGLVSILPYADFKFSNNIGEYVHYSAGAYAFVPFSTGIHGAVSIGTPDYFLNLSYLRNFDVPSLDTDSEFESFGFGASLRIGPRSRFFAEYNIMPAPASNMYSGYESFYEKGYGNAFTWGYGWFKRRFRLETGITTIGPFVYYYCDPNTCDETYHVPIPFFSFSYLF
jgi:hypothetical protein